MNTTTAPNALRAAAPAAAPAVVAPFSLGDFFKSFLLVELLKGMALTGRYAFRRAVSRGKNTALTALSWPARAAPL